MLEIYSNCLVVWNIFFPLGRIIPTDFQNFIFLKGVETTKVVIAWKPAGGDRLVNWLETRSD